MKEQIEALKEFFEEKFVDMEEGIREIKTGLEDNYSARSDDLDNRFPVVHGLLNRHYDALQTLSEYVMDKPEEKEKDEGK